MKLAVVTRVADPKTAGNQALGEVYLDPQALGGNPLEDEFKPLGEALNSPALAIWARTPVFRLGELLVLGDDDRDQFGRKPSKWDVDVEYFDVFNGVAVAKAIDRVIEVTTRGS